MYVTGPSDAPLALVTDFRLKSDADLDEHEAELAPHVLDFYSHARKSLGSVWPKIKRIALFEYGAKPSDKERSNARAALLKALAGVNVALVLPTPDTDDQGETQQANTICWPAFGAPDSLSNMRGTYFEYANGRYVLPLFPPSPWLKQLQLWQQTQWLRRAWDVACGRASVLSCPAKHIHPSEIMARALDEMIGKPIAVDIESIEDTGLITAIGFSDGRSAVSIPWEDYTPYNVLDTERGLSGSLPDTFNIVERASNLLTCRTTEKIFHNYTFDVPRLRSKGLATNGDIHDTMAAHAIAYPELRHGLQHVGASLLNIRPWKSIWHPRLPGISREDIEYWICDPIALRDYNADDAWHTFEIARRLLPQVEQCIFSKELV